MHPGINIYYSTPRGNTSYWANTTYTGNTYTQIFFDEVYEIPTPKNIGINKSRIPLHILERQYAIAQAKHNKKEMQRLEKLFANH